jgi:hypothetical protein
LPPDRAAHFTPNGSAARFTAATLRSFAKPPFGDRAMSARLAFPPVRRSLRGVVAGAFAALAGASALAQSAPPVSIAAPAWRAPVQVAGAEQPVRMTSLRIDVEVAAGVAETRLQMVFLNPNSRTLEGKLQFPLAAGQIVSGFALDVDGRMRAAVPVEKARAQQVFEDIARRRVDPGLLQTTIGNNYELRVYPLLPGAERSSCVVEPAGRFTGALAYAERVASFRLALRVSGRGERARTANARRSACASSAGAGSLVARVARNVVPPSVRSSCALQPARPRARRSRPSSATARATSRSSCRWRSERRRAYCRVGCRSSGTLPGRQRTARPTASSRSSTPTSRRRTTPASTWSASPTRRRPRFASRSAAATGAP